MLRSTRWMLLLAVVPVALGACRKKPAAEVTPPTPTQQPVNNPPPTTPVNNAPTVDSAAILRTAIANTRSTLLDVINFEYDSDELTSDARAKLDAKIAIMNANPGVRVRVEGHCDERGTDEYNLVLGRRRAEQAKRYMTDRGIDASRIETMSFGRERPVASGSSESAWAQNRRDEFHITAGDITRPVS